MHTCRAKRLSSAWCHGRAKVWQDLPWKPVELWWCQVPEQCLGAQLHLLCPPLLLRASLQLLRLARHILITQNIAQSQPGLKLKSTHWQVMAGWWLRLHLGSCVSRKPIFSWSFCPVFQLLLCRLKLIGGTSEESTLLCNLYVSESPSKARLSLSTSNNPEVKTCPSILDTVYPPVIFKLILLK